MESSLDKEFRTISSEIEKQESSLSKITLADLKANFTKYFYFSDDNVIDVSLATIIKNRDPGDPVWVFLVDVPSSGKTELLRTYQNCENITLVSSLTGQSLVSGKTTPKNFNTDKDPSLFAQIDGKTLIVKDFTTILSLRAEDQAKIFSQMRDSYDGFYDAKFGVEGGVFRYKTHYGFIGGVTTAIDNAYSLNNIMGERCLKYRMNNDRQRAQLKARENRNSISEIRVALNQEFNQFLKNFQDPGKIIWDDESEKFVETIADIVTQLRTPVNRDWRNFEVIQVMPEAEMPMRFANSLKNLGDGLAKVRSKSEISKAELEIVKKCAFDCLPKKILRIIKALLDLKAPTKHSEIAITTGLNTETVTRTCQDLFAIGITDMVRSGEGDTSPYESILQPNIREKLNFVFSKTGGSENGSST